jgi:hypothetical protein
MHWPQDKGDREPAAFLYSSSHHERKAVTGGQGESDKPTTITGDFYHPSLSNLQIKQKLKSVG